HESRCLFDAAIRVRPAKTGRYTMRTQDLDVRHLCLSRKSGRARRSPYIVLALVTALAVTAAVWAFPASAGASPSIRYGIQDDAYFSATPSLETRLGTLDQLGTKLVRH